MWTCPALGYEHCEGKLTQGEELGCLDEWREAPTFEEGTDLPDARGTLPVELPESQLHIEQRHPRDQHEEQIGDQEGTCRHHVIPAEAAAGSPHTHTLHLLLLGTGSLRQECDPVLLS